MRSHLDPLFGAIFAEQPESERIKLGDVGSDFGNNGVIHPLNAIPGGLMKHPIWPHLEEVVKDPWHNGPQPGAAAPTPPQHWLTLRPGGSVCRAARQMRSWTLPRW